MRSFKSDPDPLDPGPAGFAHRGLHGPGIPENSMAAFRAAMEMGAGIECDVRLSADGEVIVFHDHDLRRLCASALAIEATPAALLIGQRLLGTNEQLPRLFDLFEVDVELVQTHVPFIPIITRHRAMLGKADLGEPNLQRMRSQLGRFAHRVAAQRSVHVIISR